MTRLGFIGVGHLGQALLLAATALGSDFQPVAMADPLPAGLDAAALLAPDLQRYTSYEAMLDEAVLDAVVISTPTYLHLPQASAALERGLPTLLQKPVALNGAEADALLAVAAQHESRLLVDYSYRYTTSAAAIRAAIAGGALGRPLAVEARFHNIWGPGQGWFFRRSTAGGGALLDLGVHLLDLALWLLDFPPAALSAAHLTRNGRPLRAADDPDAVEDFAVLTGTLGDAPLDCAVSWQAQLAHSEIRLTLYGSAGTLIWRNRAGSFFDFEAIEAHNNDERLLTQETTDLRTATLRAFHATLSAPPPDLAPYAIVPHLLDTAFRLAGL